MNVKRLAVVRQQLIEAGVIGGNVDDFYPLFQFYVIYPNIPISLGEQVLPGQVYHRPRHFVQIYDPAYPQILEAFRNPTRTALVMSDLDPDGREYLLWLVIHFISSEQQLEIPLEELVTYEAPRARRMGTRNIVFTVFKWDHSHGNISIPESRNNFSTRYFASINALGNPLSAAFFRINNPIENDYKKLLVSVRCVLHRMELS